MIGNSFKKEDITEKFTIENTLGQGTFGEVKKAVNKNTGEVFAVKIIDKTSLTEDDLSSLEDEVGLLEQIDHPNVVKLYEAYEDKTKFYLVMEIMTGGELFDRIVDKDHYSEKEAADVIRPVVDAINYCHEMKIAHRDLKPENLLYASKDEHAVIKISDFGLAKMYGQGMMRTQCGTPSYVAPEVLLEKPYDQAVDYWSIGVILYVLLCGFPPFYNDDTDELFQVIVKGELEFPSPYWDDISSYAKDLIKKLICVDPSKRLTAKQILAHEWMVGDVTPRTELTNVTKKIADLNGKNKVRKIKTASQFASKLMSFTKK